ncbi:trypsin-like serine protease [Dokdonella sp.]|uniref:trypsin-like serine protease n=1 Tax=Dokdonella sp. TaxID=2291710 RepID=UPI0037838E4E
MSACLAFVACLPQYQDYVRRGVPAKNRNEVVALFGTTQGSSELGLICSGVAIKKDLILTAAHCACNKQIKEVRFGYQVIPASAAESIPTEENETTIRARCDHIAEDGDLATIKLKYPPRTHNASVAKMASDVDIGRVVEGSGLIITGYAPTNGASGRRNFGTAHIMDARCSASEFYGCFKGREFVVGPVGYVSGDVGACPGDSGSPALLLPEGANVEASGVIVGIASRSYKGAEVCGGGSIYVLLSGAQREWVNHQLLN